MKRLLTSLALLGTLMSMTYCTLAADGVLPHQSPQFRDGAFRNPVPMKQHGFWGTLGLFWEVTFNKPSTTVPTGAIPVQPLTRAALLAAPDKSLFRLGHSTLLMKIGGDFYLTDPVFSKRVSPVQWAGPARFHEAPISVDQLPPIKAVILSHDHYDHLDHQSILALAATAEHFITPLGVGDRLVKWGVPAAKVTQLDWWQEKRIGSMTLVATPAQHFSGRGLSDGNKTLWASWVMRHPELNLFFSGDTGYFDGFRKIGEKYGPFDVAMMETGAYDKRWPDVHMQPEETLQAFIDVKGKWLMPVHNGTFDLGLHAWREPFDRIAALAEQRGVSLATPEMGERLDLKAPHAGRRWWHDVDPAVTAAQ